MGMTSILLLLKNTQKIGETKMYGNYYFFISGSDSIYLYFEMHQKNYLAKTVNSGCT